MVFCKDAQISLQRGSVARCHNHCLISGHLLTCPSALIRYKQGKWILGRKTKILEFNSTLKPQEKIFKVTYNILFNFRALYYWFRLIDFFKPVCTLSLNCITFIFSQQEKHGMAAFFNGQKFHNRTYYYFSCFILFYKKQLFEILREKIF